jgi:hypothetical protein
MLRNELRARSVDENVADCREEVELSRTRLGRDALKEAVVMSVAPAAIAPPSE